MAGDCCRLLLPLLMLWASLWLTPASGSSSWGSWVGRGLPRTAESRAEGFVRCPTLCVCQAVNRGKRITCDLGGMHSIPTQHMDKDIRVLQITAPPEHPNELIIGRIFLQFTALEEVRITRSNVPAIGDSSFWPGKRLQILDLSHNNISILRDSDFRGLSELRLLNLSHNHIARAPSAPFRFLSNLTSLILSENRLEALAPRFLYLLPRLQRLDLSGNPLKSLDPDHLKDVRPLRVLGLARCQLTRLHSLIYQHLSNLESLDLQDNQLSKLAPEEFRHLRKLRVLKLDGNRLEKMPERVLDGHSLSQLGLSRNQLSSLDPCAFCNASVEELDMSRNRLQSGEGDPLRPLASSLDRLDLSWNPLSGDAAAALVRSLRRLSVLRLEGLGLQNLPSETFGGVRTLRELGLRHNRFSSLPQGLLTPLKSLESLDLAFNRMRGVAPESVRELDSLPALSRFTAHDNPWQCKECQVMELSRWLAERPLDCGGPCPACAAPSNLAGQSLAFLPVHDLEPCREPLVQRRLSRAESQVGLIVAIIIIMLLVTVIVATVVIYRRQGAVYYTHEDDRRMSCTDVKRPSIVATPPADDIKDSAKIAAC
ncbi:leucine-rich repeat-containing protein 15-like [Dermacentor albipictus]|uniref:leucine-rich repeat-containing protein 15-like n=1 Tax=Dermacentor albipictus TaxID=60249 RepID=UPI0031FC2DA4